MPIGGAIAGAGSLFSGAMGYLGSTSAMSKQVGAMRDFYNQGMANLQPFIDNGKQAGSTLMSLLTPGANQTATLSQIPGFQFAQDWGQKAVKNLGTTMGLGGNTLTAGANFATGTAQQGFGQLAGLLQGVYGTGANAAGSAMGNAVTAGGNIGGALGAGTLGQYNALGSGIMGAANAGSNSYLLSRLFQNAGGNSSGGNGLYGGNTFEQNQMMSGNQVF